MCGGQTEVGALLCDVCADRSFSEPKMFLNPVLIGSSAFHRLRKIGSAALHLGPVAHSDIVLVPSSDLDKSFKDTSIEGLTEEDAKAFYAKTNAMLAHLGVPLRIDQASLMLTDDAAESISTIISKVAALEAKFPGVGVSDLYIRLGIVYWSATHGILLRTASKKWKAAKRAALMSKAAEYFSMVSEKDELYSIAVRNLGQLFVDAEDWQAAEKHLTTALKHFPNDQRISEMLANAHFQMGNHMEALMQVDDSLSQGELPTLWVLKGKIMRAVGRSEEALDCFNRALDLDPKLLDAHDLVISTLRDIGRPADAAVAERLKVLSKRPDLDKKVSDLLVELKAASSLPAPPPAPVSKDVPHVTHLEPPAKREQAAPPPPPDARSALAAGDLDTAIQRAEESLRSRPDDRDSMLVLIAALVAKGDIAAAEQKVHSFYEKNRDDTAAWYWRGVVAEKQDKWGASIQYLSKAVTLDPNNKDAWLAMGDVLLKNERLSGADESYSRVIAIDGDNARAWLGKAKTMQKLGRWGAAVQCLDKYTSLVPKDKDAWLMKADLLFEKEKYRRAIESYERYLQLSEDDSYALGRKGIALNALGMVEDAKAALEESVRLDPNNREAAKWLSALKGGGG